MIGTWRAQGPGACLYAPQLSPEKAFAVSWAAKPDHAYFGNIVL